MAFSPDIKQLSQRFLLIPFVGGPDGRVMSNNTMLDSAPLAANNAYFQIWLERLSLGDMVGGNQVPTVQAKATTTAGGVENTYPQIIGPDKIAGEIQQVLHVHEAITPLLPFEGGTIKLQAGLYAVDGPNQVSPLLTFIGTIATTLVLPAVAVAVPVAQKIVAGLDTLHGAPGMHPRMAIDVTLDPIANDPRLQVRRGYLAIVDKTRLPAALRSGDLWVIDGELQSGDPITDPQRPPAMRAFDDVCPQCPYMLFSVERADKRDDWRELAEVKKAMEAANSSADPNQKRQYKEAAIAAVKLSPAIAVGDRVRIIEQINNELM